MKIAIIENTGKDFFLSRIRFAKFLKNKGNDVIAIVPNDGFAEPIQNEGLTVIVLGSNIRGKGVVNKMQFAIDLFKLLRLSKFDVVHCFRMQPNIIGGFLGGVLRTEKVINHITGLGTVFTKDTFFNKFQQGIIKLGYRFNNKVFKTTYIFQNKQDVKDLGIQENYTVIPGSAVNEDIFFMGRQVSPENVKAFNFKKGERNILFVSRLIKSKGLEDLVKGVVLVNERYGLNCKLRIVGWIDDQNTDSHTAEEIQNFTKWKEIDFLGQRNDVADLISLSDICALPSYYREGTPRFLLEAMAMGKAIITTKMPGCEQLVKKRSNGALVKPRNPAEIAEALNMIITHGCLEAMGKNGNLYYQSNFSESVVYHKIYSLYKQ